MSDSIGSLLAGAQQQKPKKMGSVYVETGPDGNSVYYPASHYDQGIKIGFPTQAQAEQANKMTAQEAQKLVNQSLLSPQGM